MKHILITAIWFKICWLSCVYFGNSAAIMIVPLTAVIYAKIISITVKQWLFVILVIATGILFDTTLNATGLLIFPENATLPPFWLTTIWFVFAILLLISLPGIIVRKGLFIALMGIGGMFSYSAGATISNIQMGQEFHIVLPMLLCCWALMGVLLNFIYLQMFRKVEESHV